MNIFSHALDPYVGEQTSLMLLGGYSTRSQGYLEQWQQKRMEGKTIVPCYE